MMYQFILKRDYYIINIQNKAKQEMSVLIIKTLSPSKHKVLRSAKFSSACIFEFLQNDS